MLDRDFGFIQGRLSPVVDGKIQAFPWDHWQKEFYLSEEMGLKTIEWTLDYDRLYENPLLTKQGQREIEQLSRETGLSLYSLTGDFFMQAPFFKEKSDLEKRQEYLGDLRSVLEACGKLGISVIVLPLVDHSSVTNEDEEDLLVEECQKLTPVLKTLNLRIAFESDYQPEQLLHLINRFDADYFGINYDIGNSASLGYDPEKEIETYGHRIINVHIKDRVLNGTTVPLGEGSANFQKVFDQLKLKEYPGKLIFQTARAREGNHCEALEGYRKFVCRYLD